MSGMSLAGARPAPLRTILVDQFVSRSVVTDVALVSGGALVTAIAAQLVVPLWPVPITGQTLAVLLVGSSLGALRGALSMLLYAVVGLIGLPVFAEASSGPAVLLGPTGGYIVGFVFAAALVGWIAERTGDRRFLGAVLSFASGTVVIFAFGLAGLAMVLGTDLPTTLEFGLYPFIIGGIVKAVAAAAIIPVAWKFAASRRRRAGEVG